MSIFDPKEGDECPACGFPIRRAPGSDNWFCADPECGWTRDRVGRRAHGLLDGPVSPAVLDPESTAKLRALATEGGVVGMVPGEVFPQKTAARPRVSLGGSEDEAREKLAVTPGGICLAEDWLVLGGWS